MRQPIVLVGLLLFLMLIPVIAGCGTLTIDLNTDVKASGDIIQEIRFEGTGMMATVLEEADFITDLEQDDWEYDIEHSDDSLIVTVTGSFVIDEDIAIPQVEGGPAFSEDFSVWFEDGLLSKDCFFEVDMPGSGDELEDELGEFDEVAETMLEGMFDISWTITLPGNIVESNADLIEGGSATWDFDLNALSSGRYLMAHSRQTNWPVIGGIIAGAVVVLALLVFIFVRIRRRGSTSLPGLIVG